MTTLQQLSSSQVSPEVPINENFDALSAVGFAAKRNSATAGLTWGYYGGRWGGTAVADGTLTLTASADNYVVVANATGALSVSTGTTNWADTTNYRRVYKITTGTSGVTAVEDHRAGPYGLWGGGGSASGMSNPMTADGDLLVGGTAGAPARLPIGSAGQVLTVSSGGVPQWQAAPSGGGSGSAIHVASVYAATARTCGTSMTKIVYDGVESDAAGMYSSSTGKFTVPSAGLYKVAIRAESATLGRWRLAIYKNGTLYKWLGCSGRTADLATSGGPQIYSDTGTCFVPCAASDYLEVYATSSGSGALTAGVALNYASVEGPY